MTEGGGGSLGITRETYMEPTVWLDRLFNFSHVFISGNER